MSKGKKENIILFGIAVIILIIAISSLSLAALKKQVNGNSGKVIYKAGDLSIRLDETGTTDIAITNSIPTSDSDGQNQAAYKFSLVNSGDVALCYKIYLDNDTAAQTSCNTTQGSTCQLLSDGNIRYSLKKNSTNSLNSLTSTRLLDSGTIAASATNTYEFRIWLDYDADSTAMGKYFFGKLRVEANQC